jgi:hypothetical protein
VYRDSGTGKNDVMISAGPKMAFFYHNAQRRRPFSSIVVVIVVLLQWSSCKSISIKARMPLLHLPNFSRTIIKNGCGSTSTIPSSMKRLQRQAPSANRLLPGQATRRDTSAAAAFFSSITTPLIQP